MRAGSHEDDPLRRPSETWTVRRLLRQLRGQGARDRQGRVEPDPQRLRTARRGGYLLPWLPASVRTEHPERRSRRLAFRHSALLALLGAALSLAFVWEHVAEPTASLRVHELDRARSVVAPRVRAYTPIWLDRLPDTRMGNAARTLLDTWFGGDLYAMRHYLVAKSPHGHMGWEKEALRAFRGTLMQTPTCSPTAFPGAVGHGKRTLRCYLNGPTRRALTSLDHTGGGNGTGGCNGTAGTSLAPGGWTCELRGREEFRIVIPDECGTRGIADFGASVAVVSDTGGGFSNDSLVLIGVPPGAPAGCRYDIRVASYTSSGAQTALNFRQKHTWYGYQTIWDEQCTGTGGACSPSEGKALRCGEGAGVAGDSAYFYRLELIGNSGDDVGTFGCDYSTVHETWAGPTQVGGLQASCLTLDTSPGSSEAITFFQGICFEANHRVPLGCGRRLEIADWAVTGWQGRNWETSCPDSMELNIFSNLLIRSKVTDSDKSQTWLSIRPNARIAGIGPPNVHIGEAIQDSGWVHFYVDQVATDTSWNDGYQLDFYTPGVTDASGGTERSFYADLPAAICDLGSGMGGDVSFGTNCVDTSGIQIDTGDFKNATPMGPTSDVADIYSSPDSIKARVLDRRLVGNRFRWNCSWEIVDSAAHNAFVDSMFTIAVNQTYPSSIPGSSPDSMQDWHPDYPTGTNMASDSAAFSFTACTRNPNGVEDSLATKITDAFGGDPENIDLEDDQDADGWPLFAEMFALTDPTVANDSTGAEITASNTHSSGLDVHLCARSDQGDGRRRHAWSCVDSAAVGAWILRTDGTEGLFFNATGAALAASSSRLDSAQVDSVCALRHWRCPPILWWNVQWPSDDLQDPIDLALLLGEPGEAKHEEGWN